MLPLTTIDVPTQQKEMAVRGKILLIEKEMLKMPGATIGDRCPLKHTFADGQYIRQITMPKGLLLTTRIHKVCHPYFILKGDVSVLTEKGVVRLKAPYSGVTPAGTKRLIYVHEDTVWTTVHVTKETDVEKIVNELTAKSFDEIGIDETELLNFVSQIPELSEEKL